VTGELALDQTEIVANRLEQLGEGGGGRLLREWIQGYGRVLPKISTGPRRCRDRVTAVEARCSLDSFS
jgi:hypothetical protein